MKVSLIFILMGAFLCQSMWGFDNQEIRALIEEMRNWPYGQKFLKEHSEEDLHRIYLFADRPTENFDNIKNIEHWCAYFQTWDIYLLSIKKAKISCFEMLLEHLCEINDEKVEILTFLLLHSRNCGFYQEALATRYSRLFAINPAMFIKDMAKRTDWRQLIEVLTAGDWDAFKVGLSKLGDSSFEKELRIFVIEMGKK